MARYRDDPDPGVHGAAGWLLGQWGQGEKLHEVDRRLADGKAEGGRRWYVNRQGQTMVVLPPGEFLLGEGKEQKRRQIDHTFALAAREVTVAEFLRFRPQHQYLKEWAPTPDCPVNMASWYDAAAYCNWLSEQEGIPREQWCYLPNNRGEYADGMKVPADFLRRTGYRLPTEQEWEYACRAGSATAWAMGDAEDLLARYAWYSGNSSGRSHPVGRLRPNDGGLFDLHGNAWEWCQDGLDWNQVLKGVETITDRDSRVFRGGAFVNLGEFARCAFRNGNRPSYRPSSIGFRPARTIR